LYRLSSRRLLEPLRGRSFALLFLSTLASSLGTLLAAVALAIDVKDRTDSGLWVGALLVADFLPTIVIGLTLGPLLDRLPRRSLMVVADLVRAGVFCALPFAPGAGTIVALAAVAGIATGFFRPAAYAGVPNLVDDEQLPAANSLLQATENASWAIGPVLGGLLTAAAGPDAAYWINAVSFLVSALLIARVPRRLLQSAEALTRGHWRDLADGFRAAVSSRPLVTVLVVWSIACIGSGIGNVVEIFLAKDTFDAGDFGYGLLFGATGFGLVVGNVLATPLEERLGVGRTYPVAIATMALGLVLVAVSPNVWVAAAFFGLVGIGNGVATVCNPLLVQRGADDRMRGRVLTLVISVNFVAIGIGMGVAGPILDAVGARGATGVAAGAFAAAAVAALVLAAGVTAPRHERAAELGAQL
jgi:MFS family permease